MSKERLSFHGHIDQLDAILRRAGITGRWRQLPGDIWRLTSADGAILNWWPLSARGTIYCQGHNVARLTAAVTRALRDR